ncbi:DNA-binding response regulator [Aquabacterium sp. OR-4]|uniref:DNA-binding response regulator n=1 Tax=Aquabacterium sp. OR-4 TaxID=2978127 RepID=UPI0021B359D9|nr:DNA-binding response regulator [Aquabacterium sp. OR-4]MDT7837944.1 DNA-binding response regulator [Aquabacterium sp. OR-4]
MTIVLLVDDQPQTLGALAQALEAEGSTVLVAHSGEAALQRLDLVTPDAILMDALMPGLSGFDTCRAIKAHAAWQHIPIIFMTGLSETAHIVEGFDAGGVDYVVKPVRAQEVQVRLATHMRNARAVRLAREAVDVGGHGVLVVDGRGRLAWQSPQAQRWLAEAFAGTDATAAAARWLAEAEPPDEAGPNGPSTPAPIPAPAPAPAPSTPPPLLRRPLPDGRQLVARRVGRIGMGEAMWLLSPQAAGEATPSRLASAALTPRETEVLSWVAKGKTNRDVADILGMSPRTVNKHLEHVFEKLGVETRAAAAALASRELG